MSSYYSIFHHIPFSSRLCSDPISCCDRVLCCCALNKGALIISSTILGVPYANYSPRNPNHTIKAPLLLALPLPLLPTTSYLCLACVLIGTCDLLPSTRCLLVTADETAAQYSSDGLLFILIGRSCYSRCCRWLGIGRLNDLESHLVRCRQDLRSTSHSIL